MYDLIANTYAVTGREDFVHWAIGHNVGFQYYNNHCDRILAISDKTLEEYVAHYPGVDKRKLSVLPSNPPYQYRKVRLTGSERRERSIILAAPFDNRKGLLRLPAFLNEVMDEAEHIYIFGSTRCREDDFKRFWKELKDWSKVVYYPTISYEDLIQLYKKCKVLLFPSLEEGLGMPIIESQMCGCRVATTDATPMNRLISEDGYLLTYDFKADSVVLKQMLETDIDTRKLSEQIWEKFSYDQIAEAMHIDT